MDMTREEQREILEREAPWVVPIPDTGIQQQDEAFHYAPYMPKPQNVGPTSPGIHPVQNQPYAMNALGKSLKYPSHTVTRIINTPPRRTLQEIADLLEQMCTWCEENVGENMMPRRWTKTETGIEVNSAVYVPEGTWAMVISRDRTKNSAFHFRDQTMASAFKIWWG